MLLNDSTTYRSSQSPVLPSASSSARPTLTLSHSSTGLPIDMLVNPVNDSSAHYNNHKATPTRSLPPPPLPQPPMRAPAAAPAIPYNPERITRPGSVLVPLTDAERKTFSNPVNSLRRAVAQNSNRTLDIEESSAQPQSLSSGGYSPSQTQNNEPMMDYDLSRKRKRPHDEALDASPPSKRPKDKDQIAFHYNARPEVGLHARRESPIFGLKAFNNWIKSVLIQKMTTAPLSRSPSKKTLARGAQLSGRVLDIGCGKGGDLQKWQKAKIKEYVALDIATVSVNQARDRWRDLKGDRFEATFAQLDCYTYPLAKEISQHQLSELFDVVTMQFCMHYAFESEQKVRMMLENVSKYLRPGGRFVGTTPNADILLNNLRDNPNTLTFGNSVYTVRFDSDQGPVYGHRYMFFLQDAVEDVPEYVVYWDNFVSVASEYGLELVYKKEFHDIFQEESGEPEFATLLKKMKVVDEQGESAMDEDQWDAANVYLAFAFEKR